ncbi:MAG: PorT family protein [Roseivirga sp.]|nr:PorT family protein [Roseivirga sp.]
MDEARGPEDRIEHIVREAEGGAQFELNPAAWSAMEAKLDAAAPVPFAWWKILFPIAGTAILLTLLLWPMAARDKLSAERALTANREAREQPLDKAGTQGTPGESKPSVITKEDSNSEISDETSVAGEDQKKEAETSVVAALNPKEKPASITQSNNKEASEAKKAGAVETYTYRASVEQKPEAVTNESEPEVQAVGGDEDQPFGQGVEMISARWVPNVLMFPQPVLVFELDSSVYAEEASETEYFQKSKWAFSAAVSADLSATGLEGFTDPGTMIGFGVEYYLADTWSIQTGATYAVKKYTALGSEYETPEWISARPDDLLSAIAKCTVIDIPFNVRKYFHTKKGKTFFASSGVSTYLMLREDYNYEYTEERPNWEPFWRYENRNNHFFGILNLSVGYETPLSKNLALGIEPFMKLPLTGIGEGRVRFLSFGTNIAIKLRK